MAMVSAVNPLHVTRYTTNAAPKIGSSSRWDISITATTLSESRCAQHRPAFAMFHINTSEELLFAMFELPMIAACLISGRVSVGQAEVRRSATPVSGPRRTQ